MDLKLATSISRLPFWGSAKKLAVPAYQKSKEAIWAAAAARTKAELALGLKPMRPLPVANKSAKLDKALYVGLRYKLGLNKTEEEYSHLHMFPAIRKICRHVEYFPFFEIAAKKGNAQMNKELEDLVGSLEPDLVIFTAGYDYFDMGMVRRISYSRHPVTYAFMPDDFFAFECVSRYVAPNFNWVSTTDSKSLSKYARLGYNNAILTQWASNTDFFRKISGCEKDIGVSFVGSVRGPRRREHLGYLAAKGVDVSIYGYGSPLGAVSYEKMVEIFNRSKINLNFNFITGGTQMNARLFEVTACGGFVLTPDNYDLPRYFEAGKEVVCYESPSDLVEKIRYYLSHEAEREKIAEAGYRRTLAEHSYEKRFEKIFAQIFGK
ncbi:glycosyltransferase [Candidatus Parvarchaeota archaeon]|nr:glycosyltransferase [Candidatus Parvarchaeota archaeon]